MGWFDRNRGLGSNWMKDFATVSLESIIENSSCERCLRSPISGFGQCAFEKRVVQKKIELGKSFEVSSPHRFLSSQTVNHNSENRFSKAKEVPFWGRIFEAKSWLCWNKVLWKHILWERHIWARGLNFNRRLTRKTIKILFWPVPILNLNRRASNALACSTYLFSEAHKEP